MNVFSEFFGKKFQFSICPQNYILSRKVREDEATVTKGERRVVCILLEFWENSSKKERGKGMYDRRYLPLLFPEQFFLEEKT